MENFALKEKKFDFLIWGGVLSLILDLFSKGMNMKKKFALLLSILIAIVFVSCDNNVYVLEPTKVSDAKSLASALTSSSNDTVQLVSDIDYSIFDNIVITNNNKSLDLNGHSLKLSNERDKGRIVVSSDGVFTLIDSTKDKGKIFTETKWKDNDTGFHILEVVSNGKFIMESGNIYTVLEDTKNSGQFAIGISANADVTINGGTITAGWYAISGNGSNKSDNTKVTINGGELISKADYAIYMPAPGLITVNGGTVDGSAGAFCLRSGKLVINDGFIQSAGTGDTGAWKDGTGNTPKSVIIVDRETIDGYVGNVDVTINGGNFSGSDKVSDKFVVTELKGDSSKIIIKGGNFNFEPDKKFISEGYKAEKNSDGKTWSVKK